jgi:hypothetical protein
MKMEYSYNFIMKLGDSSKKSGVLFWKEDKQGAQ